MKQITTEKKVNSLPYQEIQQLWEQAEKKYSQEVRTVEDKLFADFLINNYLDDKTGLLGNKSSKESSRIACGKTWKK